MSCNNKRLMSTPHQCVPKKMKTSVDVVQDGTTPALVRTSGRIFKAKEFVYILSCYPPSERTSAIKHVLGIEGIKSVEPGINEGDLVVSTNQRMTHMNMVFDTPKFFVQMVKEKRGFSYKEGVKVPIDIVKKLHLTNGEKENVKALNILYNFFDDAYKYEDADTLYIIITFELLRDLGFYVEGDQDRIKSWSFIEEPMRFFRMNYKTVFGLGELYGGIILNPLTYHPACDLVVVVDHNMIYRALFYCTSEKTKSLSTLIVKYFQSKVKKTAKEHVGPQAFSQTVTQPTLETQMQELQLRTEGLMADLTKIKRNYAMFILCRGANRPDETSFSKEYGHHQIGCVGIFAKRESTLWGDPVNPKYKIFMRFTERRNNVSLINKNKCINLKNSYYSIRSARKSSGEIMIAAFLGGRNVIHTRKIMENDLKEYSCQEVNNTNPKFVFKSLYEAMNVVTTGLSETFKSRFALGVAKIETMTAKQESQQPLLRIQGHPGDMSRVYKKNSLLFINYNLFQSLPEYDMEFCATLCPTIMH